MALLLSHVYHLPNLSSLLTIRAALVHGCLRRRPRWSAMLSTMADAKTSNTQDGDNLDRDAREIFDTAVSSVLPASMVRSALSIDKKNLVVDNVKYPLDRNVHIVGFGKAVLGMARAAEDVLGEHVVGGIVSIPTGMQQTLRDNNKMDMMLSANSRLKIYEGATDNIPDSNAQQAAMAIYDLAKSLTKKDICLTLITGGGSSLLPAVIPPLTLDDMAQVTRAMSRGGATIQQLNTVRKNLDLLKGGGLAATAQPAKVVSLVLSDVIGNPLDMIASGPTVHDASSPQQCLDLFRLLKIHDKVPSRVTKFLENAAAELSMSKDKSMLGMLDEDDAPPCLDVTNAHNIIVGSNEIMMESATEAAKALGYLPYILTTSLCGEAKNAAEIFADIAAFACLTMGNKRRRDMQRSLVEEEMDLLRKGLTKETLNELLLVAEQAANQDRPMCVMAAGETVVTVTGSGLGGRNQELALWAAHHLHLNNQKYDLTARFQIDFISAGTDGQDGPTAAAGACVGPTTCRVAEEEEGLEYLSYLENNDSNTFFEQHRGGQNLIRTGLTGTNVMDLQLLLIKQPTINSSSVVDF